MRLKSLDLKNFQCHALTRIEFDPQVTCIRGESDCGKSAILRALRWLCLNDLGGEGFIREGEKDAKVRLKVDDSVIIRSKGSGGNLYELDDKEFKAFGQGVPPEIQKVLGVNEINFQAQHDSPFWFNETAGEVSRRLNAVIDLSVIDSTLSAIASAVRTATDRKTITGERLAEAKTELEKIAGQKKRVEDFIRLRDNNTQHETLKKDCRVLSAIVGDVQVTRVHIDRRKEQYAAGEDVLTLGKEAIRLDRQHGNLDDLLGGAKELGLKCVPPPAFGPVEETHGRWEEVAERWDVLDCLIIEIKAKQTQNERLKERATEAEQEFHKKTKGMICPLCQQEIK